LVLEIERHESALLRIVSSCHRRRCRIVALTYELPPQMQAATLTLDVLPPPQGARTLVAWLSALVDVRRVAAS
jgi:acetolactate synthase regulatory subunit